MTITTNVRWADNTSDLAKNLKDGLNQIEATRTSVDKLVQSLDGDKLVRYANTVTAAINQVGVSTLTAAQASKQLDVLERAMEKLSLSGKTIPDDMKSTAEALRKVSDDSEKASGGLGHFFTSMVGGVAAGELFAHAIEGGLRQIKDMITFLPELALEGSKVAGITRNFERLTEQAGLTGDVLLNTLRSATHKTVTDFELMKTVNQDLAAGLNLTTAQFGTLATGAFALAKATGVDVKSAFDTMNDAMLTGRTRSLALLTGKIDLAAAEERYAKTLGTTAEHLTSDGKMEAARVAILDAVADATKRIGEQGEGLGTKLAQVKTAWANFQEELGKTIATSPVIMAGMRGITDAIQEALGAHQEDSIRKIVSAINDAALAFLQFSEFGVTSAGFVAKEVLALYKVLGDIAQVTELGALGFKELALAVAEAGSVGGRLGPMADDVKRIQSEMDGMIQSIKDRGVALKAADAQQARIDEVTKSFNATLEELRAKLVAATHAHESLAGPTNQTAAAEERAGKAAEAHGEKTKQTSGEVSKAKSETDKYNESLKNVEQTTRGTFKSLDTLSDALVKQITGQAQSGAKWEDLKRVYKLTDTQVQALQDTIKLTSDVLKTETVSTQINAGELAKLGRIENDEIRTLKESESARRALGSARTLDLASLRQAGTVEDAEIERLKILTTWRQRLNDLEREHGARGAGLEGVGTPAQPLSPEQLEAMEQAQRNTAVLTAGVGNLSAAFAQVSQISGDSFGGAAKAVGMVTSSIGAAQKAIELFNAAQKATGAAAAIGTAAASASYVALALGISSAISDAVSDANVEALGQHLGNIYGTEFSASAAAAIHDTSGLLQTQFLREHGGVVPEGIPDLQRSTEQAATVLNTRQLVSEAGGLNSRNVDQFADHFRNLFRVLDEGLITADQATKALDENFSAFATAGTDRLGILNNHVREFIRLNDEAGTHSQHIDDYVRTQVSTNVIGGVSSFLNPNANASRQVEADQQKIADLNAQLTEAMKQDGDRAIENQARLRQEIEQTTAHLQTQQRVVDATQIHSAAAATAVAGSIVAAFSELQNRGASVTDALKAVSPSVAALQDQLTRTGLDGGQAFADISRYVSIANDAVDGPLLDSVGGLGQALVGLNNTGLLTQDTFSGLSDQVASSFDELIAQGVSGDDALRLMKPTLQQIYELQQDFGFATDDATQQLLDQAVAAGVVGETQRPIAERQLKATQDQTAAIDGLTRALTAGLGGAIDTTGGKMDQAFRHQAADAISVATGKVHDLSGAINSVPDKTFKIRGEYEGPSSGPALGAASGGIVWPGGVQLAKAYASGGMADFSPQGTDTIPAMLTPGELVMNVGQQNHVADALLRPDRGFSDERMVSAIARLERRITDIQLDQPRQMKRVMRDLIQAPA